MILVAEDIVQRKHTRLWRHGRGVGGRCDDEVDVTGADLLQHHRLLAELRARELVDAHRAFAQFHELGIEDVTRDAVSRRVRLIVTEGIFFLSIGVAGHGQRYGGNSNCQAAELLDRILNWYSSLCYLFFRAFEPHLQRLNTIQSPSTIAFRTACRPQSCSGASRA